LEPEKGARIFDHFAKGKEKKRSTKKVRGGGERGELPSFGLSELEDANNRSERRREGRGSVAGPGGGLI